MSRQDAFKLHVCVRHGVLVTLLGLTYRPGRSKAAATEAGVGGWVG